MDYIAPIVQAFSLPLRQSLSLLESVDEKEATEQIKENISSLQRSLGQLELLDSLQKGVYELKEHTVDGVTLMEDIIMPFFKKAHAKSICFMPYIDPKLNGRIRVDTYALKYALQGLIEHAISRTKSSTLSVHVRVVKQDNTQVKVAFVVKEVSRALKKEQIMRLVRPFELSKKGDLALGIATSYYVIKFLQSKLKITSSANKPNEYGFVLDMTHTAVPIKPVLKKAVIYVDEDLPVKLTKVLLTYLEKLNIKTTSTTDIKCSACNEADVIFVLTASMDVYQTLKSTYSDARIVVLNSIHHQVISDGALKAVSSRLTIPILLSRLIDVVTKKGMDEEALKEPVSIQDKPQEVQEKPNEEPEEHSSTAPQQAAPLQKMPVLVVEDNAINLKLVQMVLARYECSIDTAQNGQIAVDKVKQKQYGLIFMDIDMPIMDGVTATQKIKAYQKSEGLPITPIVALTSHDMQGDKERFISQGLDDHIAKPLNKEHIETMFEKYNI